jgi:hypothetical protein
MALLTSASGHMFANAARFTSNNLNGVCFDPFLNGALAPRRPLFLGASSVLDFDR